MASVSAVPRAALFKSGAAAGLKILVLGMPIGTALDEHTPRLSPDAKRLTQRMATQIIGESGLRNSKLARLGAEK
jgi:hypothetical protein